MNAGAPAFERLIDGMRARLWFKETAERLMRSIWWSVLAVLACALIHRIHRAVPLPVAFIAAMLPVVLVLGDAVVRRRPSRMKAAMAADTMFASKSLLTAALEITTEAPPNNPNAALLLHRAEHAAGVWQLRLNQERLLRPHGSIALPAVLLLASAFVLLLPGTHVVPQHRLSGPRDFGETMREQHETASSTASTPALLSPSTFHRPDPTVTRQPPGNSRKWPDGQPGPEAPAAAYLGKAGDQPAASASRMSEVQGLPSLGSGERSAPGSDAARNRREVIETTHGGIEVRPHEISRRGLPRVAETAQGQTMPLAPGSVPSPSTHLQIPIARSGAGTYQPTFSIPMRTYVDRYFATAFNTRDE